MNSEDGAERLVRRLRALSELQQRVAILSEEAERLGMPAFADLLAVVFARAKQNKGAGESLTLAATMAYLESNFVDLQKRAELMAACREAGYDHVIRLLFEPSEHRTVETEKVPDYGTGRPLTLGERKSLARRPNRQIIERVMGDPHPGVIEKLLRNPRLTETDVIRMVSRRPSYSKVIREVFNSPRWGKQYSVKISIASNPYSPPSLVLKLLPQLMKQDLEKLLDDRNLHPSVLVSCKRLLEQEPEGFDVFELDDDETLH